MFDLDAVAERVAAAIAGADALLIGAGAGMGVDSGLPDFRGDHGFWKAYPPFRGRRFAEMSNPVWFGRDPQQAWGFFGHRFQLYRDTVPHDGFLRLHAWCQTKPAGYFVFTSNVDGHFQAAGFPSERIVECHGSIRFLQCARPCSANIWPAGDLAVDVDMHSVRATSAVPVCPACRAVARPNILMFGDAQWLADRTDRQFRRYGAWLEQVGDGRLVILEFGAGTGVPTVRLECEGRPGLLVRVNPRDSESPPGSISMPVGALEAIQAIDAARSRSDRGA